MHEATFEQAYPIALRAAQVRATAAVICGLIPATDRQDFEQEGLIACWRALPKYDPGRASLRTFVERVVAARLAAVVRKARRAPESLPLSAASSVLASGTHASIDEQADLDRRLARLSNADEQLVRLLMEHAPGDAGRRIGLSRSTVHTRIVRLRRQFTIDGLESGRQHSNGGHA